MTSVSVAELYNLADIVPNGAVCWGEDVPSKQAGVYVISVKDLLGISFKPPSFERERAFWRLGQEVIYIGRAKQLNRRLRQFRRHVYGRSSPHRGGQAILLLDCAKTITWAEVEDYGAVEARLIEAFRDRVGGMPFGNRVRSARISAVSGT